MSGLQPQQTSPIIPLCDTDSCTIIDWTEVFGKPDLLGAIVRLLPNLDARNVRQISSGVRSAFDKQRVRLAITDRELAGSQQQMEVFISQMVKGVEGLAKRGCDPRELSLELNQGPLAARRRAAAEILAAVQPSESRMPTAGAMAAAAAATTASGPPATSSPTSIFAPTTLQLQACLLDEQVARTILCALRNLQQLRLVGPLPPSAPPDDREVDPQERPWQSLDPEAARSAVAGLRLLLLLPRKATTTGVEVLDGAQEPNCAVAVQDSAEVPRGALPALTHIHLSNVRTLPAPLVETLRGCSRLQRLHVDFAPPLNGQHPQDHDQAQKPDIADAAALGGLTQLRVLHLGRFPGELAGHPSRVYDRLPVSFPASAVAGFTNLRELHAPFSKLDVLALGRLTSLTRLVVGTLLTPPKEPLPEAPCWPLPPHLQELCIAQLDQRPDTFAGLQPPPTPPLPDTTQQFQLQQQQSQLPQQQQQQAMCPLRIEFQRGALFLLLQPGRHAGPGGVLLPAAERVLCAAAHFLARYLVPPLRSLVICPASGLDAVRLAPRGRHSWLASLAALTLRELCLVRIQLGARDVQLIAQALTSLEVLTLDSVSTFFAAELLSLLSGLPRLRMLYLGADELCSSRSPDPVLSDTRAAKRGAVVAALLALYAVGRYLGATCIRWGGEGRDEGLQEAVRQVNRGLAPSSLRLMLYQLQRGLEEAGVDPGRVQLVAA